MQGGLIDNHTRFLADEILKLTPHAKSIDIGVGYFFFSGFEEIKDAIRDIPIRILVGLEIDPQLSKELGKKYKDGTSFRQNNVQEYTSPTRTDKVKNFLNTTIAAVNNLGDFDEKTSAETLEILLEKLENGTLEIKATAIPSHAKYYVFHLDEKSTLGSLFPGVVIMGSSNLTTSGLRKQGEKNDLFTEPFRYKQYSEDFENDWNDSKAVTLVDKSDAKDVVKLIKESTWPYKNPSPYFMFLRVLMEYYSDINDDDIYLPGAITDGLFSNLQYQIDAVKEGIAKIDEYSGVIVADVVGLGKSIIGSTIAYNLYKRDDLYTIIIAPPHLVDQWKEYKDKFGFIGEVWSRGEVKKCFDYYKDDTRPKLIIVDEAHRFRNELTYDYTDIHQMCIGHKVLLLSATPFNNDPKDIYALVKLFQIPGAATLRSAENLGVAFRELIKQYSVLRKDKKSKAEDIKSRATQIADDLRRLIDDVVIRRSRLDLDRIDVYREDLIRQGIAFPEVSEPENVEYPLGSVSDLYLNTLRTIYPDSNDAVPGLHYLAARYQPTKYFTDEGRENYKKELAKEYDDESEIAQRLEQGQSNVAKFMRHLLVRRFESSKEAFRKTLEKLIDSNELIIHWYEELGAIPISKKLDIPDPDELIDEIEIDETLNDEDPVVKLKTALDSKNLQNIDVIPAKYLSQEFIDNLREDDQILRKIHNDWFQDPALKGVDPKLDKFKHHLEEKLNNSKGKVIVFSEFTDTVNYLKSELSKDPALKGQVISYSGSEASNSTKKIIAKNFDAGLPESEQENDYRILIATDAISEGYNLHRADCVYNYDIPYNPTRVIQRIGRINRVNKKMYDRLYIFNFFPSAIGEAETHTKSISTVKVHIFNALLGDDTKKLTTDEELVAYYSDKYNEAKDDEESESPKAKYFNIWQRVKNDQALMGDVSGDVVNKSRVARDSNNQQKGVVLYGKRGDTSVFCLKDKQSEEPDYISAEEAMGLFEATTETKGLQTTESFEDQFEFVRNHLRKSNTHVSVPDRGRQEAIAKLKILLDKIESSSKKNYCNDLIESIYDLDALADSELKTIRNLIIGDDPNGAYDLLLKTIPIEYIANIRMAANVSKNESSLLILTEELL